MPRCNLTLKQKAQLIELSKELSTGQLAKKFRVHTTTVTRTIRKKDRILQQASRVNPNFKTVQTNLRSEEHDSMMLEYIKDQQEANRPISVSDICDKAVEYAEALGREIKSQRAWWRRFKIRCNVVKSKLARDEKPRTPKKNKRTKDTPTKSELVEITPITQQIDVEISSVVDLLKETVREEAEGDLNNKTNSVIIGLDGETIESSSMASVIVEIEPSDVLTVNGLTDDAVHLDSDDKADECHKVDDQSLGVANMDLIAADNTPKASGAGDITTTNNNSPTKKTRGRPRKTDKISPKKTSKRPKKRTAKTGKSAGTRKAAAKKTDNTTVINDNKNFTFKVREPAAKTVGFNKTPEKTSGETHEI